MDIMNSSPRPRETVICAAVRASNGKIVSGRRHNDAIRKLSDLVRKTGAFDVEKIDGSHTRMRVKPADGGAKVKTK